MTVEIEPYRIEVPDAVLEDLHQRLDRARWPDEVQGAGWEYGVNRAYLQALAGYWRSGYDWRTHERALNTFPQFRAIVQNYGIHFLHVLGQGPHPLPLLLTHGWPSSFAELTKLIPHLTDPARFGGDPRDAFSVVVPSIPGFGFSDIPASPGMTRSRVADLLAELMTGLGYHQYGAHCNDIGAVITAFLAIDYPGHLIGMHTLMPGYPPPAFDDPAHPMTPAERTFQAEEAAWDVREGGYNHIQETRPQTLAY